MQVARGRDGEVSPHILHVAELELVDLTRRGLEAEVGILGGDAHCNDVALGGQWLLVCKSTSISNNNIGYLNINRIQ